ncbi:hypothetical protein CEXT_462671 [Caerostris extrusa]|uniref:Uncharacterized protein n=1 Tax=Caerostris extrusa TaxID=172846 RepID=A0AAV4YCC0_CAEEX|nr:hypothetical protein CEXT_462671 [Caerostris extrusa]
MEKKKVKGGQQFHSLSSVFYLEMTLGLISHEDEGLSQGRGAERASSQTLGEVTRNERGEIQSALEKQSPGENRNRKCGMPLRDRQR